MMRVSKLRRIKLLLDKSVKNLNHFIYIGPLNQEHYTRYIEIIKTDYQIQNISDSLTNDDILITTTGKIDVRIDILVDTNLYVGNIEKDELDFGNELLEFLVQNNIDYKLILNDLDLINALENKPNDELNTNAENFV